MRGFIKGLVGLIVLLVVLWLGGWWYGNQQLKKYVTAEINRVNQAGNTHLSYDKLASSSSPFTVSSTLVNWKLQSTDGTNVTVGAATFGAHVDMFDPLLMHIDIPASININTDKGNAVLTIASSNVVDHLSPSVLTGDTSNPITGGDGKLTGIALVVSDMPLAKIDSFTLHETTDAKAGANATAVQVDEALDNLAVSEIIAKVANIPFDGKIAHLGFSARLSGPFNAQAFGQQFAATPKDQQYKFMMQQAHSWAQAGGSGDLKVNLLLGPSQFNADASVKFDNNAQPSGTGDLTANHLDQFTAALTNAYPDLQDYVTEAQAMLSDYLSTTPADGQVLTMHSTYGKDGIVVNGKKLADMPPVDWNKVINMPWPPKAADDATDDSNANGDGSGADTPAPAAPGTDGSSSQ